MVTRRGRDSDTQTGHLSAKYNEGDGPRIGIERGARGLASLANAMIFDMEPLFKVASIGPQSVPGEAKYKSKCSWQWPGRTTYTKDEKDARNLKCN